MSEAWTDDKIREGFIYDGGESEYHDPEHGAQTQRKIAGDIFDVWLSEHDRQVAERAWDEGQEAGLLRADFEYGAIGYQHVKGNPYTKGEQK